jgi:hypothetical protein
VLFEPADHPGQRTLAEVHRAGQFLYPELVPGVLGEGFKHLELDDPEAVPLAQARHGRWRHWAAPVVAGVRIA